VIQSRLHHGRPDPAFGIPHEFRRFIKPGAEPCGIAVPCDQPRDRAPLLSGRSLNAYLACGVRNCHETTSLEEGLEKLSKGMQVLIREGTVSQDLAALVPLIDEFTSPFLGFCTDDRNPLDIDEEGHIDHLVRRAIALGAPATAVYRTASWSAVRGFGLRDRGLVAHGYLADILLLDDLASCAVHMVLRRGRPVTEQTFDDRVLPTPPVGNSVRPSAVTARTNIRGSGTRPIHAGDRHHSGKDPDRASAG
jgi:adenine deaminase